MNEDIVEVEGPDGNIYEFPAGTTRDQAVQYFVRNQAPSAQPVSTKESFKKGLSDPYAAAAQWFEKVLPESVVKTAKGVSELTPGAAFMRMMPESVRSFANEISPDVKPGIANEIARKEAEYESRRNAAGQTGVDWGRVGGNLLSPVNIATSAVAAPLSIPARLGIAGLQGALSQPLESTDNFAEQKARQAGLGVVGGGLGEVAGRTLGRVVSPAASRNPDVQKLMEEGVTPTLGHLLGPKATTFERALHVTPILGTAINRAEHRTFEDFNRAVANRVLRNVGETVPKDVKVGTDLFAHVDDVLKSKYEQVLPKLKAGIDQPFQADLGNLNSLTRKLAPEQRSVFDTVIKDDVIDKFTSAGMASGQTLKEIESVLGKEARDYMRSADMKDRKLGTAFREAQAIVRDLIERQNPQYAKELKNINSGWAALTRMENATASSGAAKAGGVFTPEEYMTAVRNMDSSLRKRAVARGEALDQDFAQAAQRVLARDRQGLISPMRLAGAAGMGGAYVTNPGVLGTEVAATLPYSPLGQKVVATALGRRPQFAEGVRNAIKSATPLSYGAVTSPLQQYRDVNPEQIYQRITED